MSNLTDIILNDGKTTPVAHTFKPAGIDAKGVATFEDRVSGIALAFPKISFSLKDPAGTNGLFKQRTKLILPVLKSATGANAQGYVASPSVSHQLSGFAEFNIPTLSTLEERKDFLAFFRNMVASTTFADQILNYERWY